MTMTVSPGLVVSVPSTPPLSHGGSVAPRTNSLVITSLPTAFFHPSVLEALRSYFAAFGEIYAWAPIRSFARIILVYYSEDDAESAKLGSDGLKIEATLASPEAILRVYRADPTPILSSGSSSPSDPEFKFSPNHLRPPPAERNFLISPPGSPPVGWESTREEPPNNSPLASDLMTALRRLQISQENEERGTVAGVSVLIEPEEGPGVGVYVEDCGEPDDSDGSDAESKFAEEGWFYGRSSHERFAAATMRPPMPTSA